MYTKILAVQRSFFQFSARCATRTLTDWILILTNLNREDKRIQIVVDLHIISSLFSRFSNNLQNVSFFGSFIYIYFIIISSQVLLSSRKYYYQRRPIGDPQETHWRPIGDPSETDMPDMRPIEDLNMLHRRLTRPIGD